MWTREAKVQELLHKCRHLVAAENPEALEMGAMAIEPLAAHRALTRPETRTGSPLGARLSKRVFLAVAARYKGMLPCLRGGLESFLFSSMRSAAIRRGRVSRGSITSSR